MKSGEWIGECSPVLRTSRELLFRVGTLESRRKMPSELKIEKIKGVFYKSKLFPWELPLVNLS